MHIWLHSVNVPRCVPPAHFIAAQKLSQFAYLKHKQCVHAHPTLFSFWTIMKIALRAVKGKSRMSSESIVAPAVPLWPATLEAVVRTACPTWRQEDGLMTGGGRRPGGEHCVYLDGGPLTSARCSRRMGGPGRLRQLAPPWRTALRDHSTAPAFLA
jgi:hypothetical protein